MNATDTTPTTAPKTVTLADRSMAAFTLTELGKSYAKHVNWLAACAYYSAASKAGEPATEPKLSTMPGKAAKHRMYGQANRVIALLDLDVDRPSSLADIGLVISAAFAALWYSHPVA
jgi:hypothetical protein